MSDVFPTEFYRSQGILLCPNGDQVRSDEEGLFCWLDGKRVPYPVMETVAKSKKKKGGEALPSEEQPDEVPPLEDVAS